MRSVVDPTDLTVRNLHAGYGKVPVLHDVSLDLPSGATTAVLGPNGAGKTTLLRSLWGRADVTRGEAKLGGIPMTGRSASELVAEGMCYITDERDVFPSMTVDDNLAFFARSGSRDAFDDVYDMFPILAKRRRQLAGTMSGGEQQMLALARVLIVRPRILMIDELSTGLAPVIVDELFEVLGRLAASGDVSILLVEQYAHRALELADLVYVLDHGRVVYCGEPIELQDSASLAALYLGGHA